MKRVVAILLFLTAFAFYVHGDYPSVSAGDSGEFMTAASTLGIPHPSGFPTYTFLARSFEALIPWGNPAYRINLFSAFAGALSVLCLFEVLTLAGLSLGAAVLSAVLWAFSAALVANSQATEVFTLHAVFLIGILWAGVAGRWFLASMLLGLAAGNHQTIVLIIPAVMVAMYMADPSFAEGRKLGLCLFFFLIGYSINLLILFRAQKHPFLNVGQGETLERLMKILRRTDFGTFTLALGQTPERTLESVLQQLNRLSAGIVRQTGWAGLTGGVAGVFLWFKKNRMLAWLFLLAFLLTGPFFFLLGNLPFDAQSNGLLERFYMAPALCWILLAAATLDWLPRQLGVCGWLAGILIILWPMRALKTEGFRYDFGVYSYGRNTLRSLAPHSIFLMDGGDDTFYSVAYLTQVEKRRPDVELHDRGGVVFAGIYGEDFRALNRDEKENRRQSVEHSLAASGRILAYSTMNPHILSGQPLELQGLVYAESGASSNNSDLWSLYDLRRVAPWTTNSSDWIPDYRTRALIPFYAYQRGVLAADRKDWANAVGFLGAAHAIGPDILWLTPNLIYNLQLWAYQACQESQWTIARRLYDMILDWHPNDSTALANQKIVLQHFPQ